MILQDFAYLSRLYSRESGFKVQKGDFRGARLREECVMARQDSPGQGGFRVRRELPGSRVEAAVLARAFAVVVAGDEEADNHLVPDRQGAPVEPSRLLTSTCH
jgi:hypothetical protein